jgi:hypothetical protein
VNSAEPIAYVYDGIVGSKGVCAGFRFSVSMGKYAGPDISYQVGG